MVRTPLTEGIYTQPEVAAVGLTEEALKAEGLLK